MPLGELPNQVSLESGELFHSSQVLGGGDAVVTGERLPPLLGEVLEIDKVLETAVVRALILPMQALTKESGRDLSLLDELGQVEGVAVEVRVRVGEKLSGIASGLL